MARSDSDRSPQQSYDYELLVMECVAYASHSVATEDDGVYEQIPE